VAWACRQADKAEPAQDLAHAPLCEPHTEAPLNHRAEVDPAPAHHPVRRRVRPSLDDHREFLHLRGIR
jgi:hypothetical protein